MNAFSWLNSLTNFERKVPGKYSEKAFSLDRYRTLLDQLGNPHLSKVPTVHILGTDGKGSTLAFLESLLSTAGKKTKAFISPHLVSVEERFRSCGESVSTSALNAALVQVQAAASALPEATYFEVLNAAFWVWVEGDPPDVVLLETGLGGRLDTTSVCLPALKILTRLERDHIALLGKTMELISGEKLAALSSSNPVVIAPQSLYLMDRLRKYSAENALSPIWAEEQLETRILSRTPREWHIQVATRKMKSREFALGLPGDHQADNFGTALLAFEALGETLSEFPSPLVVRPDWRGRCQVLTTSEGGKVVLDGSHTAMGGQALRAFLDQALPRPTRTFLFACSRDRNPWCYLRGLIRKGDSLRLVQYAHSRLWRAAELRESLMGLGWSDVELPTLEVVSAEEALKEATSLRAPEVTVVCGSLYWVGAALGDRSFMGTLQSDAHKEGVVVSKC